MTCNRAGALLMLLGMAAFAGNDAIGKWLVADYGVAQVILLRSLAAGLLMAPLLLRGGRVVARIRAAPRPRLQALRAICATAEVFCFYLAVSQMPLADVMAFWMARTHPPGGDRGHRRTGAHRRARCHRRARPGPRAGGDARAYGRVRRTHRPAGGVLSLTRGRQICGQAGSRAARVIVLSDI